MDDIHVAKRQHCVIRQMTVTEIALATVNGVARAGGGGGDICPQAQGFRGAKIDNYRANANGPAGTS